MADRKSKQPAPFFPSETRRAIAAELARSRAAPFKFSGEARSASPQQVQDNLPFNDQFDAFMRQAIVLGLMSLGPGGGGRGARLPSAEVRRSPEFMFRAERLRNLFEKHPPKTVDKDTYHLSADAKALLRDGFDTSKAMDYWPAQKGIYTTPSRRYINSMYDRGMGPNEAVIQTRTRGTYGQDPDNFGRWYAKYGHQFDADKIPAGSRQAAIDADALAVRDYRAAGLDGVTATARAPGAREYMTFPGRTGNAGVFDRYGRRIFQLAPLGLLAPFAADDDAEE